MKKSQADELRKAINNGGRYATYYSSKAQTLSVRVYSYINNDYNPKAESEAVYNLLVKVPVLPEYELKRRTYQGFIHDTCIIFH